MAKLDAGSVDLAFADPPFNIGYDYDIYDDRKAADDYLNWSRDWIKGVIRVLKPNGTFWLAIGDEYAAELKLLCTKELGLHCRSWVIWFYTFGVHCKQKFTRSHAHLFHFVKDAKCYTFNAHDVRVPSARQLVYRDKRAEPGGRMPDDTWMATAQLPQETPVFDGFVLRPQDIPDRFPPHSDTWYFSRVAGTFGERQGWHGCQMPEQLLGRIIRSCSNPSEVVLDPFVGSGTTLAVAKKLSRRFVGFELSESYFQQGTTRLKGIRQGDALVGPANPERSSPRTTLGRSGGKTRKLQVNAPTIRPLARTAISIESKRQVTTEPIRQQTHLDASVPAAAIIEALVESGNGQPNERVAFDPELNERFRNTCERLNIPGTAADWNWALLNLRKQGKLASIESTVRLPRIPPKRMEQFAFASEIAWRILFDNTNRSLDRLLADPETACEFDAIARRIAPGFTAFEYRWAALSIRKKNDSSRKLIQVARYELDEQRIPLVEFGRLPMSPAHYAISAAEGNLYVGYSGELGSCALLSRERLEAVAEQLQIPFSSRSVRLSYCLSDPLIRTTSADQTAIKLKMVEQFQPLGNFLVRDTAA